MDTLEAQVSHLIFSHLGHTPTDGQRRACTELVHFLYDADPRATFVLRGYAGTGKTSLVGALIKTAPALRLRTLLLAPTGRAAKVLSNYSECPAFTIHKKIYTTITDEHGMMHTGRAPNKHSYTLFIVDEASMISDEVTGVDRSSLLQDLIDYVRSGSHCRLMFIGDGAQLPPVGSPESPALDIDWLSSFADLKVYTAELCEVVRQRRESGILYNATLLREQIVNLECGEPAHTPIFDLEGFADIVRLEPSDIEDVMNREFDVEALEEVALVCRSNKRANGYNQMIRNRVLYREEEVNAGDYLMVVKNNYFWLEQDSPIGFVANGDIVEVLSVRRHEELYGFHFVEATLRFVDYPDVPTSDCKLILETLHSESPALTREEQEKLFASVMEDYADLPTKGERLRAVRANPYFNALQVKFSYALTCHKTQGGQWKTIFVDQGYFTEDMLDKEYLRWLYTALTRATQKVYLLNFRDEFFFPSQNE